MPRNRPDRFAFAAAYMGVERLGGMLRKFEKITHVFCGHTHWRRRVQIDRMDVLAIGSTYTEKRLEIVEL